MPVTQVPDGFSHCLCSSPLGPVCPSREYKSVLREQEPSNTRRRCTLNQTAPQLLTFKVSALSLSPTELSSSPPGPYHQEPYVSKPEERFKAPPILPPHLLQVILNKDTGISVSTQHPATSCKAAGEKTQLSPISVNCWVHLCPGNERASSKLFLSEGTLSPSNRAGLNFSSLHFTPASACAPFLLNFMTQYINYPFSVSYGPQILESSFNHRIAFRSMLALGSKFGVTDSGRFILFAKRSVEPPGS